MFSDEDLKRFTDEMIRNLKRDMGTTTTFMGYDIAALLARLDASEKALFNLRGFYVCQTYGCPNDGYDKTLECDHDERSVEAFDQWIKVAGK